MEHSKQNCRRLAEAVVMGWDEAALRERAIAELAESKDVWVEKGDSYPNIATSSVTVDEIVSQMVEDDA